MLSSFANTRKTNQDGYHVLPRKLCIIIFMGLDTPQKQQNNQVFRTQLPLSSGQWLHDAQTKLIIETWMNGAFIDDVIRSFHFFIVQYPSHTYTVLAGRSKRSLAFLREFGWNRAIVICTNIHPELKPPKINLQSIQTQRNESESSIHHNG